MSGSAGDSSAAPTAHYTYFSAYWLSSGWWWCQRRLRVHFRFVIMWSFQSARCVCGAFWVFWQRRIHTHICIVQLPVPPKFDAAQASTVNIKSVRPGVIDRVGVAVAALSAVVIRSQRVTGNDNNAARCRRRPFLQPVRVGPFESPFGQSSRIHTHTITLWDWECSLRICKTQWSSLKRIASGKRQLFILQIYLKLNTCSRSGSCRRRGTAAALLTNIL